MGRWGMGRWVMGKKKREMQHCARISLWNNLSIFFTAHFSLSTNHRPLPTALKKITPFPSREVIDIPHRIGIIIDSHKQYSSTASLLGGKDLRVFHGR
jgi:hypothetical protein